MIKFILIKLISSYKYFISPIIGQRCRFFPSCSSYAIIAITRHGALKGSYLALKRIVRCNPWGGFGIDEVPD